MGYDKAKWAEGKAAEIRAQIDATRTQWAGRFDTRRLKRKLVGLDFLEQEAQRFERIARRCRDEPVPF
ncbi:hypothetical protein [Arenimonas sp.]|uniref:hypothetical protein n=1 Tax=Arenimonas sp. TaxID=1872635 RepID=UPI0039E4E131